MAVLDGRVAIVTGSGTGLGRGIAQELAEAGASVAVLEIDGDSALVAADELARIGVEARAYPTDVAQSAQVDESFAAVVRDFGRLDIVVNNAGISRVGPHTQDVTDEDWHDSIAVMQSGVFYCMRAAGRVDASAALRLDREHLVDPRLLAEPWPDDVLRAQGGGDHDDERRRGRVGRRTASASTRSHPASCARRCGTRTSRAARSTSSSTSTSVPLHRLGLPSEVGKLAVFLCSDDAAYITGSVHTIDGALTAIPAA